MNNYLKFNSSNYRDQQNIDWFKSYNSHALAKRWLDIFEQIIEKKSNSN